jgi:hypothetical protein
MFTKIFCRTITEDSVREPLPFREVNKTVSLCGSIIHTRTLLLRKYSTDVDKTDKKSSNVVRQVYSSPNHIAVLCLGKLVVLPKYSPGVDLASNSNVNQEFVLG